MKKLTLLGLTIAAMLSTQALAADILDTGSASATNNEMSKEVVVTATRTEQKKIDVPASITIITKEDIQKTKAKSINDVISNIPGILSQNRSDSDDVKIVIRGVGSRAGWGLRGMLILLDGVPVSDIDPHKNDLVDMNTVERVEVIRGPYSTIYGSQAMGGVINIITQKGKLAKDTKSLRASLGSFNTQQYNMGFSGKLSEKDSYYFAFSDQSTDGYRKQSKWNAARFFTREDFSIDDTSNVELMYSYSNSRTQLPGDLTLAQYTADPTQANPFNYMTNWQRNQVKTRLSTIYTKDFAPENNLMVNLFYQDLILDHPIYVYIDNYTNGVGTDVRWSVGNNLMGMHNTLITGLNYENNTADLRNWVNSSTPAGTVKGMLLSNNKLTIQKTGLYAQDEVDINNNTKLVLGLRNDNLTLQQTDLMTPANPALTLNTGKVSPKVALNYKLSDTSSVFANYSTGFNAPPYFEAFANNVLTNLLPEEATSYEVGYNGGIGPVGMSLSLYNMNIVNEIFGTTVGMVTTYANSGETNHQGAELSANYHLTPDLSLQGSYTVSKNTYTKYLAFNGKDIPANPDSVLVTELKYNPKGTGFNGGVSLVNVGGYFVDNANTIKADPYSVVNLRLGYKLSEALELWVVGDNVLGTKYATIVSMNGATPVYTPGNAGGYTFGMNYNF